MRAMGGGGSGGISGIDVSEMETTHADWFVITANNSGITVTIHAEVNCAAAGQAVAARAGGGTTFKQALAAVRAEQAKR
jgi:hypothetical protein